MRTPTSTIWRTVVFAGAMLATPALGGCKKSSNAPATTPEANEGGDDTDSSVGGDTYGEGDEWGSYGDPCEGRPRGGGDEGGEGRGFVLS